MTTISQESFIPIPGGKLFCRSFGKNTSPLIILHGGPGLGFEYLLPGMSQLEKFSFPIFYDQRGTGKSTSGHAWSSHPFQTYVDDINQVRKFFNIDKVNLLAHSWGSILVSQYALAFPNHVDKIIYANPVPISSKLYLEYVSFRTNVVDAHEEDKKILTLLRESSEFKQGDIETVKKYYRMYFKSFFYDAKNINALSLDMSPQAAIENFKIYELFYQYTMKHSFDFYQGLKTLKKPSLIIACENDVIPMRYMQILHDTISGSRLEHINNCGHFPYIEQAGKFFEVVEKFLK